MSDVGELRDHAERVRALATQTRAAASELRRAEGVDFVSDAAERYREDLRREAGRADAAAGQLDDAARALLDHAREVEQRLAQIEAVQRWFGDRLEDARRELGEAVDGVSDAASEILDLARRAPAIGSPDWLDFGRRWLP